RPGSQFGFLSCLAPESIEHVGRLAARVARGLDAMIPVANQQYQPDHTQSKREIRDDPGDAVESAAGGRDENRGPVFLDKRLESEVVAFRAVNARCKLAAHAVRISTTYVVTLEQHLVATANAHQLMAELIEARIVARTNRE